MRQTWWELGDKGGVFVYSVHVSDYYIDEGCCQMFIGEPNCLNECLKIIANESIYEFTRDLFSCADAKVIS